MHENAINDMHPALRVHYLTTITGYRADVRISGIGSGVFPGATAPCSLESAIQTHTEITLTSYSVHWLFPLVTLKRLPAQTFSGLQ